MKSKNDWISTESSHCIEALSFFFTCAVALIHLGGCIRVPYESASSYVHNSVIMILYLGFMRLAVPYFFVVSGFFLVKGMTAFSPKAWSGAIRKRVLTLLVPMIGWNFIHYIFRLLTRKYILPMNADQVIEATKLLIGWDINSPMACGHFWYIRVLFVYVVMWPLFYLLMRNRYVGAIILCVMGGLRLSQTMDMPTPIECGNMFFFAIGVYVGFHREILRFIDGLVYKMKTTALIGGYLCAIVVIVIESVIRRGSLAQASLFLCIIPGLLITFRCRKKIETALAVIKKWQKYAFFIYGVHVIIASQALMVIRKLSLPSYLSLVSLLVAWICVIVLSAKTAQIVEHLTPRVYSTLTGGRVVTCKRQEGKCD